MSPVTIALLSIFICILLFWLRWRKRQMSLFEKYGIPGPKPNFITGNLIEFNQKREKCINEWIEKYGKIFGFYLGGKPYIVCYDSELAKLIQIKEYKIFMNKDFIFPDAGIPHRIILEGLSLLRNEKWITVRSILSPNFSPAKTKMISTLISDSIKTFLEKITENNHKSIEIYQLYKKLVIDTLCRTTMGIQTNVQIEETSKFVQSIFSLLQMDSADISAVISILFPEFEPVPMYVRRIVACIKYLMNYSCVNVVMNSCQNIIDFRKKSRFQQPDLLQLLINVQENSNGIKRKITDNCIVGNAANFLIAGYDTTSTTLAWITYYLAKHREIQEKVRQEIINNIEKNKEIEYADLSNFKYLDQVVSETLRFHPLSILVTNRQCSENFQYKNITIPKNVFVLIPTRNLHKDPNYWKEPEKFDPERFSSKNAGNINASIYQPFGSGPRSCIGMRMAQAIIKLTLSNLIRYFKLELSKNTEIEEERTFFINRPKNGVNLKLTAISH